MGSEKTFFRQTHETITHSGGGRIDHTGGGGRSEHRTVHYTTHDGSEKVCNLVWKIADCVHNIVPAGQYSYPFQCQVPGWLPASMALSVAHESSVMSIEYQLIGSFKPVKLEDYDDSHTKIRSKLSYVH